MLLEGQFPRKYYDKDRDKVLQILKKRFADFESELERVTKVLQKKANLKNTEGLRQNLYPPRLELSPFRSEQFELSREELRRRDAGSEAQLKKAL